jgi:hypothetical protein
LRITGPFRRDAIRVCEGSVMLGDLEHYYTSSAEDAMATQAMPSRRRLRCWARQIPDDQRHLVRRLYRSPAGRENQARQIPKLPNKNRSPKSKKPNDANRAATPHSHSDRPIKCDYRTEISPHGRTATSSQNSIGPASSADQTSRKSPSGCMAYIPTRTSHIRGTAPSCGKSPAMICPRPPGRLRGTGCSRATHFQTLTASRPRAI